VGLSKFNSIEKSDSNAGLLLVLHADEADTFSLAVGVTGDLDSVVFNEVVLSLEGLLDGLLL